jgi:hypothetical protein
VDNQHRKITGYRDLSQAEVDLMNLVKAEGERLDYLTGTVQATDNVDQHWVSIGRTQLQQGIMALVRAVARPSSF